MKILLKSAVFLTLFAVLVSGNLFAQTEEELMDELLLSEGGSEAGTDRADVFFEEESPFSMTGLAEFESGVSLYDDPFFYRNQGRIKLKPSYENSGIRAYADIDFFANPGDVYSTNSAESLECVEAYIEGSGFIIWKIGKQRFNWGVGDSYQPTNLLDRPDLRESFMRDNDDRYTGVYALSLKYMVGDYAVEAAFRPVTEKALYPKGFYGAETEIITTPAGKITSRFRDNDVISDMDDVSAALRFGGTSGDLDWHVMYYSGMNRDILYSASLNSESGEMYLDFQPVYRRMNVFGADLSYALSKLNIRLEGMYSPDMPALTSFSETEMAGGIADIVSGSSHASLQSVKHRDFFNYTAGFDINLWGENGKVFVEWMQARYIDEDDISPVLLTDVILVKVEDSFLDQYLNISASSLIRTRDSGPGLGMKGEAEYDFKNGMTMALGAYMFVSNGDDYIEMVDDKNLVYLDLKYSF